MIFTSFEIMSFGLGAVCWWLMGFFSFRYWWTKDHTFEPEDMFVATIIGFCGPVTFLIGFFLHSKVEVISLVCDCRKWARKWARFASMMVAFYLCHWLSSRFGLEAKHVIVVWLATCSIYILASYENSKSN
jgi:hypothetical protein